MHQQLFDDNDKLVVSLKLPLHVSSGSAKDNMNGAGSKVVSIGANWMRKF